MAATSELKARRQQRLRYQLRQKSGGRPRLSVFRSGKHLYAQVIDDASRTTLAAASSLDKSLREALRTGADKGAAAAVGGCVQQQPVLTNDLVGYAPQQLKVAAQRAEAPAGVSTVEFKELGDTKRGLVIERLVRQTWDESCKPTWLLLRGYLGNGSSQWDVRCKGTMLVKDYVVTLPERAHDTARVLKCYAETSRVLSCNVVGPRTMAPTRTASET